MFKRTVSSSGLKEALALRNERRLERQMEIEKLERDMKPARVLSISSYFNFKRASPDERRKIAGIRYAKWEENEEMSIRAMAAKVLQQRWRTIRCTKRH